MRPERDHHTLRRVVRYMQSREVGSTRKGREKGGEHTSQIIPHQNSISRDGNVIDLNHRYCDERSSSRVDTLLTNHFPRHVTVTT